MERDYFYGLNETESFFALYYEKEGFINDLERSARKRQVPIIRREMVQLLGLILDLHQPKKILEIGTAVGFSALLMSQYLPANGKIITIERNPLMWREAEENIEKAKIALNHGSGGRIQPNQIEIQKGDAAELLKKLDGAFDLIFLDAAKAQYINYLPELLRLLRPEGLLITDNVLQSGEIMASRFLLTRRERTTHKRMREYLRAISRHPQLQTTYLGIADGVTISKRLPSEKETI